MRTWISSAVAFACCAAMLLAGSRPVAANPSATVTCVHRLSTTFGITPGSPNTYPNRPIAMAPASLASRLCVYEVAGWALFAPTGWTGSGMVGADGSRSAQLSYQNEAMSAVSYTSYGSVANAAPYFPSLRKSWNSAGYPGPEPSAIPGLRETALTSDFVRYSLPASTAGLFTDGIIFNGVASKGCTPTVVQFEIMLTAADHDLAGAILNRAYVAVLQPMLKTCNYKAPDPSTVR